MGFDARSRERLEALGRQLPSLLPQPQPVAHEAGAAAPVGRHPIETETDPERLFQELMRASDDGSVPPHLLERLKQVEAQRCAAPPTSTAREAAKPRNPGVQRRRPQAQDPQYVAFEQLLLEDDHDP